MREILRWNNFSNNFYFLESNNNDLRKTGLLGGLFRYCVFMFEEMLVGLFKNIALIFGLHILLLG